MRAPEKLAAFGVEYAAGQRDVYGALFLPVRLVLVWPAAAFLPALEVLDVLHVVSGHRIMFVDIGSFSVVGFSDVYHWIAGQDTVLDN